MKYTKENDRRGYSREKRILTMIQRQPNGCWNWTGLTCKDRKVNTRRFMGYGILKFKSKRYLAHRFSWETFRGIIPEGKMVCHGCDNPRCVNPDHLFIGTAKTNMGDCVSKKRHVFGNRTSKAKLTEDAVRDILANHKPYDRKFSCGAFAKKYNVSESCVYGVVNRTRWTHIS